MNSEERHLHPAAMIIDATKTLRRWIGFFAAGGAAAIFSGGMDLSVYLVLGAIVVAAGSAVWGVLSWRATRYWTSGSAFHLRQGVLQKNERTIPLEHVQSVDTVQGIIQRIFQVVEVRIETAGGGTTDTDASLSALDRGAADLLRGELEGVRPEVDEEEVSGPTVLRRLGTKDLLVAGATSGQIGVALSLVAIGSQFFDNFISERLLNRVYETIAPNSILALAVIALAVGLFAWLLGYRRHDSLLCGLHPLPGRGLPLHQARPPRKARGHDTTRPYTSRPYIPKVSCVSRSAWPWSGSRAPATGPALRTSPSRPPSSRSCPAEKP